MVTYGDVRKWDAEWLHEAVGRLNQRCTELVGLSDELSDAGKTNRWHGEASLAARDNLNVVSGALEDLVSEIAAMRTAMAETADAVTGLLHGVTEAEVLAGKYYLRIEDNGTLRDTVSFTFPSEERRTTWERDRDRVKAELADRIKEIIRRADDIDHDLSSVISKCLDVGGVGNPTYDGLTEAARAGGDAGHLSMLEPPLFGTAAANAAWFSTLGEGEKNWVLANRPDLIGNLDGVPAHYRHQANVARIPTERARLQAEHDAKLAELRSSPWNYLTLAAQLKAIEAKLDSLNDVEEMLKLPDRHLLVLDTTGERTKAAISVGDVDTANHVAVFTPGMDSTVNDRMEGYDKDAAELRKHAQNELNRMTRDESVAVVTWLNYEPPHTRDNPLDAAGTGRAEEGGARLASFLNGIDTSRADDPHLTALGHSYGSLTTGIALRDHATGVDDVAVFGSPGLGVDNASRLQAPQGHVYNLAADGDPVAHVGSITENIPIGSGGWHGSDPSSMSGMHQLSTHEYTAPDGRTFDASHGHSEYLVGDGRHTTSEWNLANIVAGTGITH